MYMQIRVASHKHDGQGECQEHFPQIPPFDDGELEWQVTTEDASSEYMVINRSGKLSIFEALQECW